MQNMLKKESTDSRAAEAVAIFFYQAKKWIGTFATVLEGLDTLVFSGGIGENAPVIRSRICTGLNFLGISLSEKQNQESHTLISGADSRVKAYVIPTN